MAVETTPKKILDKLQEILDSISGSIVPIGGVLSWLKSFTNTPSLPSGFVECNGQTLSDADSVYNGQVIPNLNGGNRFLRGNSTSGGTGGSSTHSHLIPFHITGDTGKFLYFHNDFGNANTTSALGKQFTTDGSTGTTPGRMKTQVTSTLPIYYEVVWIIRVK